MNSLKGVLFGAFICSFYLVNIPGMMPGGASSVPGAIALGSVAVSAFLLRLATKGTMPIPPYVLVYVFALMGAILASSVSAPTPLPSLLRGAWSVASFAAMLGFLILAIKGILRSEQQMSALNLILLSFGAALLIGQTTIPEWRSGVNRMSGGTNPNTVAVFGLLALFIALAQMTLWKRGLIAGLSAIVYIAIIAWSQSRGVIFGAVAGTSAAFLCWPRKRLSLPLAVIFRVSLLVTAAILAIVAAASGRLGSRLANPDNLFDRADAWQRLWEVFVTSPIFGALGWWGASDYISSLALESASSPHSLYFRLIAEVGVIGLMTTLSLPILLIGRLARSAGNSGSASLTLLCTGFLIALFARDFFENSYLIGVFSLPNMIVAFAMAAAIVTLSSRHAPLKSSH